MAASLKVQVREHTEGGQPPKALYSFDVPSHDVDKAMKEAVARVRGDGRRVRGSGFVQDSTTGSVGGIVVTVFPREGGGA